MKKLWVPSSIDQPQRPTDEKGFQVHFDGYLYYKEMLFQRFRSQGYHIPTDDRSDTVLVAHAYRVWGETCPQYLEGDYAFVIQERGVVFAARSPLGMRPLFYAEEQGQLVFASDVRQILEYFPQVKKELDSDWIAYYVTTGYALRGSIFASIKEVAGGTSLLRDAAGRLQTTRFWHPELSRYGEITLKDAVERYRYVLTEAIRQRVLHESVVVSDISGGLDSSTVVALASEYTQVQGIHGGSCEQREHDGHHYARLVGDQYKIPIKYLFYEQEAPTYVPYEDAWAAIPSTPAIQFGAYYQMVSHFAQSQRARVWLRGGFGDPLYGGRMPYLFTALKEHRFGYLLRELLLWNRAQRLPEAVVDGLIIPSMKRKKKISLQRSLWLSDELYHRSLHLQQERRLAIANPFVRNMVLYDECIANEVAFRIEFAFRYGIEIREPYADPRVIATIASFPPPVHIKQNETKHLIREMTKEVLPEEVRTRSGKGNIARVLIADLQRMAPRYLDLVRDVPPMLASHIDGSRFERAFVRATSGDRVHQPSFFSTLTLIVWAHQFLS